MSDESSGTTFRNYLVSNPPATVGDVIVTIMDPTVDPKSILTMVHELHADTLVQIKNMGKCLVDMCTAEISKRGT